MVVFSHQSNDECRIDHRMSNQMSNVESNVDLSFGQTMHLSACRHVSWCWRLTIVQGRLHLGQRICSKRTWFYLSTPTPWQAYIVCQCLMWCCKAYPSGHTTLPAQ